MAKKITTKIILIAGILLLVDGLFLVFTTNLNTGTAMTVLAGAFFAACGIWHKKVGEITAGGFMRVIKYIIIAILILAVAMMVFLACESQQDTVNYREDVVIVLGAAVHGDQVSLTLSRRLDKAVEYAEKNPAALIVVSGGQGQQEAVTEASAMEQYLIGAGISKERILKEEKATSTYENFKFSRQLLDSRFQNTYTCAYVTSDYHLYRAGNMAASVGIIANGLGAETVWYTIPAAYIRESLAVIKSWFI